MSELWFPRAVKDGRAWTNYALNGAGGSKRVGLHTTENGQSASCKGVANYMWSNAGPSTGYSILYHPTTGEFLQLRPFNVGAGSLKNKLGGVETNKNGALNFQVSVVAYAAEAWWVKYPLPYWDEFIQWVRSWGIPDKYVQYTFAQKTRMSNSTWTGSSHGWYGHAHAPENHHTDPGAVPDPWALQGGSTTPPPATWEPYDSNADFHRNLYRKSPGFNGADVKWVQRKVGVGDDGLFGDATGNAVTKWQSANGLTADGVVGPQTAAKMGMPGATAPTPIAFPLPKGHWFGVVSDNPKNHSGTGLPATHADRVNIKKIQSKVNVSQDGLYGSKTASAVKSYQSKNGLAADGLVGQQTWDKMF